MKKTPASLRSDPRPQSTKQGTEIERNHRPSCAKYALGVYLLRRVGNLTLAEVANRAGVTVGRISQIQTKIENGETSRKMAAVLKYYKVKD